MGHVHINIPRVVEIKIKRLDCPTCGKSRFMVCHFEEWYGWSQTCLKCGESWGDGEMRARPFCRGWRKEAVRNIKEFYRRTRRYLAQQNQKTD